MFPQIPLRPKLLGKEHRELKLNMTQRGFNTDVDARSKAYPETLRDEKHRIIANHMGQCTNAHSGQVVNVPYLIQDVKGSVHRFESKLIWAMDDSGNVYIDISNDTAGVFHSTMMGGYRPVAAGEMVMVDGRIAMLNEESGHYAPSQRLNLVVDALKAQGFDMSKVKLQHSHHDNELPRVDKLTVRKELFQRDQLAAGLKKEKWPKDAV